MKLRRYICILDTKTPFSLTVM